MTWKNWLELGLFATSLAFTSTVDAMAEHFSVTAFCVGFYLLTLLGWSVAMFNKQEKRIDELQQEIRSLAASINPGEPETGIFVK